MPKRRGSGLAGAAVANTGSRRDVPADTPPDSQAPIRVNRAWQPPARVTVGKNVGLHVSWLVYRGKGSVTFTPEQVMSWEDTRADDGALTADGLVTTTVTRSTPQ